MWQRLLALFLWSAFGLSSMASWPQTAVEVRPSSTPELNLKTILAKQTYNLNEVVVTQAVFTNLTEKTLCFPKPDQERTNSMQGYLTTEVIPPPGAEEREAFIEVIDGRAVWPRERL